MTIEEQTKKVELAKDNVECKSIILKALTARKKIAWVPNKLIDEAQENLNVALEQEKQAKEELAALLKS